MYDWIFSELIALASSLSSYVSPNIVSADGPLRRVAIMLKVRHPDAFLMIQTQIIDHMDDT